MKYTDEQFAIHCATWAQFEAVKHMLNDGGFKWKDGAPYTDEDQHFQHVDAICIIPTPGSYSSLEWDGMEQYTIIEAMDFINDNRPADGQSIKL